MGKDVYDGITIGDYCTELWLERNAVLSRMLGKGYAPAYDNTKSFDDPGVKSLPDDDVDSKVYKIVNIYNPKGGSDVNIQDQTSPAIYARFWLQSFEGVINGAVDVDTYYVTVPDADIGEYNTLIGNYLQLVDVANNSFYQGRIVAIDGFVLELDTPLNVAFADGSVIAFGNTNLAVNGDITADKGNRKVFKLRSTAARIASRFDVTRLIFSCITDNPVNLSLFADLAKLKYGIHLRRTDGVITPYWNVKDNKEIKGVMFDFDIEAATNPAQGQDGFGSRSTNAGQSKLGVAFRIEEDDELELIVQDDLSLINDFEISIQGHIVE